MRRRSRARAEPEKCCAAGIYKGDRVRRNLLTFSVPPHHLEQTHLCVESFQTTSLTRVPPATVPSSHTSAAHFDSVAISAFQNNNNTYTSQDVHLFVNSSTSHPPSSAPRNFGQSSTPLETPVSSSSQPPSHHVLTHPIRRPRTSHMPAQHAQLDFQTLSANYLNMLSQKPTENTMAAHSTSTMSTVTPADLEAPVIPADEPSALHSFEDIFATSQHPQSSGIATRTS
ncbi:hypothetical protein HYPSUDRAFT_829602 [Hypholoma sublateritium FD-334 SS-4]|uniref:Uncharacterized protein n=1 Tax=Hypholoma sublateritium (strain FD-334 SS-4) TaxID=945553 RepID=A0A0D2L0B2_HYPSF|nr:hypothetical protein HYPSUDRAFT_829602 [Hypholoma sublateritium FD-334 SS-4]